MRQFGFKNFRKFADFPPIDLAPITILVGENNAGKSTVVKGILALSSVFQDFLLFEELDLSRITSLTNEINDKTQKRIVNVQKRLRNIKIRFNTNYLAHIGTFKRALYNHADSNSITFYFKVNGTSCSYIIKGDPQDEESVTGTLTNVNCSIDFLNVDFFFDLINDHATIRFNPNIDFNPTGQNKKNKNLQDYFSSFNEPIIIEMSISDYWAPIFVHMYALDTSLINVVEEAINTTLNLTRDHGDFKFKRLDISEKQEKFLMSFFHIFSERNKDDNEIGYKRNGFYFPGVYSPCYDFAYRVEYLYAHAVAQTVIYSAKDSNDYISSTIHKFATQKERECKHLFIQKWMKEFGVGCDYKIKSVGGEAHIVHIVNNDGEEVNLADKGMGSIQLMVLLFRLAINLPSDAILLASHQDREDLEENKSTTFIIEEPEQNLHPMLQSKLADFLFELNTKYNFRFIIETHSEYLVRRSQVIVGDKFDTDEKLKTNPFKVYYFPSKGIPYDMVYTTSGLFEKKFGEGFINEAGKLHMALLKNAQKQK